MQTERLVTESGRVFSANPDNDMEVLTMIDKDGEMIISKTIFKECPHGIGDEDLVIEFAKHHLEEGTYRHLLAAKAFNLCLHAEPEPGKVYVIHSGLNIKTPFRFAQFINKRIRSGIEYLGWCSMNSLDDDWMLIGETLFGPKEGVLAEYPVGGGRNPVVIAEVVRI